jgi:hypothetical protein
MICLSHFISNSDLDEGLVETPISRINRPAGRRRRHATSVRPFDQPACRRDFLPIEDIANFDFGAEARQPEDVRIPIIDEATAPARCGNVIYEAAAIATVTRVFHGSFRERRPRLPVDKRLVPRGSRRRGPGPDAGSVSNRPIETGDLTGGSEMGLSSRLRPARERLMPKLSRWSLSNEAHFLNLRF